jgi:O-antigen biosynthesis protein WbqP
MKRFFDIVMALCGFAVLGLPILAIALLVRLTSRGSVLYWSDRVGRYNVVFKMPKFRTMMLDTPPVATHLLADPNRYVTQLGKFLRKSSLDELPQLFSILKGDMSFVGPRPALFNQDDLIALRTAKGVQRILPGLTGWAQVNGRDDLPIPVKVEFDEYYLKNRSMTLDLKILLMTASQALMGKGVKH